MPCSVKGRESDEAEAGSLSLSQLTIARELPTRKSGSPTTARRRSSSSWTRHPTSEPVSSHRAGDDGQGVRLHQLATLRVQLACGLQLSEHLAGVELDWSVRGSTPTLVGAHPTRAWLGAAEFAQAGGARAGNRTLNLGIKRLPTDRLRASQGIPGRLSRIRVMTQSSQGVSRCLIESLGEAVNEAVTRFHALGLGPLVKCVVIAIYGPAAP